MNADARGAEGGLEVVALLAELVGRGSCGADQLSGGGSVVPSGGCYGGDEVQRTPVRP